MSTQVEANARLTSSVGLVLLLPLALVLGSGLAVQRFLLIHALLGFFLIPLVLLKLGSTGYRFVRYYARHPGYRSAGPPRLAMRILGPVTVFLTVAVFATGIELWLFGIRFAWAPLHHASAYLWFVAMLVHVINYFRKSSRLAIADWRDAFHGRFSQQVFVLASLVVGIIVAVAMLPFSTPFALPAGGG